MVTKTKEAVRLTFCDRCEEPMLWTFAFVSCELFCPNCGATHGMMDGGRKMLADEDEIKKHKANERWFKQIRPHLYMGGERRKDCEKCSGGEYHVHHLTLEEMQKQRWAMDELKKKLHSKFRKGD
jgi:hypothetical protein